MSRSVLVIVLAMLVCFSAAWASNPGEPLDCGDWVFLEPGLSCRTVIPFPCIGEVSSLCEQGAVTHIFDNGGFVVFLERVPIVGAMCGEEQLQSFELVSWDGLFRQVVAHIDTRCVDASISKLDTLLGDQSGTPGRFKIAFDRRNGTVYIPTRSLCEDHVGTSDCDTGDYDGFWLAAIEGFTTVVEALEGNLPVGPPGPQGPQGPPGPLLLACPDADGDAWADCTTVPTCNPYGHPCGDCDDTNVSVFPGAPGNANCELPPEGAEPIE